MPDEPPIQNYDQLTEDRILMRAHQEVDRAMSRAGMFLDSIRDYEESHQNRASLLDDLDVWRNDASVFTSRWDGHWTSRWGAHN